jgi:hypothetical protein
MALPIDHQIDTRALCRAGPNKQLDDPHRREVLAEHLGAVRWGILATNVDEIIAIDFTDYNYQTELERLYRTQMITLPFNSIHILLLSSDMELCLPNKKIFSEAAQLNNLIAAFGKDSIEIEGRTYFRKPLHILRPKNLKTMTISLKDSTAQKKYFELGQKEAESLFAS